MSLNLKLEKSVNEKDVENIYRSELIKITDSSITSPYGVDGLLEAKNIRTLLEFKYNDALKNKLSHCNVLIQCLYYLKKFENAGDKLPTTIFVGDNNECFAIHTNSIVKYLSSEIDWKIAPSEAHKKNITLVQAMVDDVNIMPFIYDVDSNFNIKTVIDKIKDFSSNIIRKVRVTQHNIVTIYDYFDKNVLGKVELTTNEKANLFIQLVVNPNENYLHPKRKNILISKSFGEVSINHNLFNSFFQHFEGDVYSPKEKEELTGLVDRLIEDSTRRQKGEFFTPTSFVDLAHKYISDTFGEDWKENYIIWDCAWGTGNLTRDYRFKELYCSTLEQSDLETAEQMAYNPEATKFQYDFLNDDNDKLPIGLINAIENGKKILFLINPPYQDGSELSTDNGISNFKGNIQNSTNTNMINEGWGKCSKQLFAQFLYKITKLQEKNSNINIGIFCPPIFLTGESYNSFRPKFLNNFIYKKGFLFEACHFSDVAKNWGISFTLFESGKNNTEDFLIDIVDFNDNFELSSIKSKLLYNTDNNSKLVNWVKTPQINEIESIGLKSSLNTINEIAKIPRNTLGTLTWQSNNVSGSQQFVTILSQYGKLSGKGSIFITEDNFINCNLFFTSRRLISGQYANWINWNDEFIVPNENHSLYQQFVYDSIVYAIFETKSNQSSLREIDYKGKKWNIKNEFFWLSKDEIQLLANFNSYDELYKDAKNSDERFIYTKLFGKERIYDKLSPDAKEVLDMATDLTTKSIKMRKLISENNPEYHLDSWDAGYAQLKLVWKEYFKAEFTEFRNKYKALEDRMRPLVYELGFLK